MNTLQARLKRDRGELTIPPGGATISETLELTFGQTIHGGGRPRALIWKGDAGVPAVRISGSVMHDLVIRDLWVKGGHVVINRFGDGNIIDGISVMQSPHHGIVIMGAGDGARFANLRAYECAGHGIDVVAMGQNYNLFFDHVSSAGNRTGMRFYTNTSSAQITGPVIQHGILQGSYGTAEMMLVGRVNNLVASACHFERKRAGTGIVCIPDDHGGVPHNLHLTNGTVIPEKHTTTAIAGSVVTGAIRIDPSCNLHGMPVLGPREVGGA